MDYRNYGGTVYIRADKGDEIELRPVCGGTITKKYDPETGTSFWNF
ncbi:MAG: hypothetical protein LIR25_07565 [bacterium]|nr:hypothetical protein [bacterium]